jgi:hypothetical protein
VDLRKAYDSVPREVLWSKFVNSLDVPPDLVACLKLMYCDLQVHISEDLLHVLPLINVLLGVK